jgi:hypothetical protein
MHRCVCHGSIRLRLSSVSALAPHVVVLRCFMLSFSLDTAPLSLLMIVQGPSNRPIQYHPVSSEICTFGTVPRPNIHSRSYYVTCPPLCLRGYGASLEPLSHGRNGSLWHSLFLGQGPQESMSAHNKTVCAAQEALHVRCNSQCQAFTLKADGNPAKTQGTKAYGCCYCCLFGPPQILDDELQQ